MSGHEHLHFLIHTYRAKLQDQQVPGDKGSLNQDEGQGVKSERLTVFRVTTGSRVLLWHTLESMLRAS